MPDETYKDYNIMKQDEMDRIYRNTSLEEIPWNVETPPDALVELVEIGKVKPCKTMWYR